MITLTLNVGDVGIDKYSSMYTESKGQRPRIVFSSFLLRKDKYRVSV